jgi:hypothetical protein
MASQIDKEQAKSLMQEFRTQNQSKGEHALLTPDGQHIHGYFLDRESLENILSDKNNAGIHVYFAKHPDFAGEPDNVNTLLYTGSEPNPDPKVKAQYLSKGPVFVSSPPCPPVCSII